MSALPLPLENVPSIMTKAPRADTFRQAHLTFAFMLVSAAIARIVMSIMGTPLLDPDVVQLGVLVAAIVGAMTSFALGFLHARQGFRKIAWLLIPTAGAFVGMTMQALLLANKPGYRVYVIADGISSNDPIAWVLVGAPFGALPGIAAGALLYTALRFTFRTPSLDARERMLLPITIGCTLLHVGSLLCINGLTDAIVIGLILVLGVLALIELLHSDRKRITWLRRVFAGEDPNFAIESFSGEKAPLGVPHVVGGIDPRLMIVGRADEKGFGYRIAARVPHALTAYTIEGTIAPLFQRRKVILTTLVATMATIVCGAAVAVYRGLFMWNSFQ